jgi:hypothetical protein
VKLIEALRPLAETPQWAHPGTVEQPRSVPQCLSPLYWALDELSRLSPGWDSYRGQPTTSAAASRALELLIDANWRGPVPNASPMADGGVTLEWGDDDHSVELIVRADADAAVLIDLDGEMTEWPIASALDPRLAEALRWASKLAAGPG